MLTSSIFSFSQYVFYPIKDKSKHLNTFILLSANTFNLVKSKILSFNPFPNKPRFLRVCSTSLLKTLLEKEKLLIMSNFFFSNSVFYQYGKFFYHFHQIQNCCLQTLSVWKSLKFVVWEWVKELTNHFTYQSSKFHFLPVHQDDTLFVTQLN